MVQNERLEILLNSYLRKLLLVKVYKTSKNIYKNEEVDAIKEHLLIISNDLILDPESKGKYFKRIQNIKKVSDCYEICDDLLPNINLLKTKEEQSSH